MYTQDPITIVLVNDEHFMPMAAALLKSIQVNHHTGEPIEVYMVSDGISSASKKKLEKSIISDGFRLFWRDISEAIPQDVKLPIDKTTFPITVYARYFMAHYLPKGRKRALFLDTDMIVRKDISSLWHTDLGDNIAAAVQDPRIVSFDNDWGGVKNYQELGIDGKSPYFNAGLYLVDLVKWEAEKIGRQVLTCVHENIKYANYPDQYAANIVLRGRWYHLDSGWNHFASEENPDPELIHFISRKPMYTSYEYSKVYQEEFFKYLRMTEWRNFKPIGESARYIQKIRKVLDKIKAMFS